MDDPKMREMPEIKPISDSPMAQLSAIPKLAPRNRHAHKGNFGRVFIIAGSQGMTGAACLTTEACLRSGAGLVTLGLPCSLLPIAASKLTCAMTKGLLETETQCLSEEAFQDIVETCKKMDVVAMGPGLGLHPSTQNLVHRLVTQIQAPLVIDADALNALAHFPEVLLQRTSLTILTPHLGEFVRLCPEAARLLEQRHPSESAPIHPPTASAVEQDEDQNLSLRLSLAQKFAQQYHCILVLKTARTIVTDGTQYYVNHTGNPGMATGGSGDVLTGILAALLGQHLQDAASHQYLTSFQVAQIGVWAHGAAGDWVAQEIGEMGMMASDLLPKLPLVFRSLQA